jgi:hypothetical protein
LQLKRFEPLPRTPPAADQILTYAFPALWSILLSENVDALADLGAKPFVPLQLAAHTREEITRIDVDAVELDLQRARLCINDDAAGRMQRVLVPCYWDTGLRRQLISVIVPGRFHQSCDDFIFELRDVNRLWHGHRQDLHHAASPQDCATRRLAS